MWPGRGLYRPSFQKPWHAWLASSSTDRRGRLLLRVKLPHRSDTIRFLLPIFSVKGRSSAFTSPFPQDLLISCRNISRAMLLWRDRCSSFHFARELVPPNGTDRKDAISLAQPLKGPGSSGWTGCFGFLADYDHRTQACKTILNPLREI